MSTDTEPVAERRRPTRRTEPHPAQAEHLERLRAVAQEIADAQAGVTAAYEKRARLVLDARALDPPPTRVELAEALNLSDAMLSRLLREIGAVGR